MSLWLWVLVVLAAAGVLTAITGAVMALTGVARLQRRLAALRKSSFVTKLESLHIQMERLARVSSDTEDLRRRADAATESLRNTPELAGVSDIRNSWLQCVAQIRAIVGELS
jgi:ABC-type multidrug transport system fused ATPase/permease subunit